jgi:uncharacterized protein YbjT (DUF2867 family)
MNVLIAGATGSVGGHLVRLAKDAGHRVTALSRAATALDGIADRVIPFDATQGIPELSGHDVVISALGAPIALGHRDRRSFRSVDFAGNLNLLKGAKRGGVQRFVYVSVHVETGYAATAYVLAHEEFGNALQSSGLDHTIVRPTGIFSAFDDFIPMARRGLMMVLGDGSARTNPIHPADVARVCLDCIEKGPSELDIGGPDILTRRQIAELAFEAIGKRPRLLKVPATAMDFGAYVARMANPRLGELLEFLSRVATLDCIATALGSQHLSDYFKASAAPSEPSQTSD